VLKKYSLSKERKITSKKGRGGAKRMSKVLGVEFIVTIYAEQSNNCEAA
jgi:hypothetical protein